MERLPLSSVMARLLVLRPGRDAKSIGDILIYRKILICEVMEFQDCAAGCRRQSRWLGVTAAMGETGPLECAAQMGGSRPTWPFDCLSLRL